MKTMSAHSSASRPWATWYERPSPPVTRPGAAPHSRTSYGMLARVVNTCAGIPTSSGFAPSSTSTATRNSGESDTGRAYVAGLLVDLSGDGGSRGEELLDRDEGVALALELGDDQRDGRHRPVVAAVGRVD